MKRFIYIILCLSAVPSLQAQTIYKDQVRVENTSISRSDDNRLTIAMDIVMLSNMEVSSNDVATLTPMLEAEGHNRVLREVVIYGRRRAIVNERDNKMPKNAYTIIRRKDKTEQKVSYLAQFPYEAWMRNAELKLNSNLGGCCDMIEKEVSDMVYKLNIEPAKLQPYIAYITPQAESVKHRAATGKAFLDYPVNQIVIRPEYRNNSVELSKIRATIDTVRNDRNTSITSIKIEGYASPEGSYASNARLAEGRTNVLKNYVRNYYQFDSKLLQTTSTPEDWDGLRHFVSTSSMDKKSEVLQIIDNKELDYDVKEKTIAKLIGPDSYRYLLNECYPALRHSDYTVNYTVRGFNLEETKEIINKHPQQLSLQEIFNVAQTYEKGSEEFNHAFRVAVLMFPEDPIANFNAAAMEIQKGGDLTMAKKYLKKADQSSSLTQNNWGVIFMLEGNYEQAGEYFSKAKSTSNSEDLNHNLEELKKQKSYPGK